MADLVSSWHNFISTIELPGEGHELFGTEPTVSMHKSTYQVQKTNFKLNCVWKYAIDNKVKINYQIMGKNIVGFSARDYIKFHLDKVINLTTIKTFN